MGQKFILILLLTCSEDPAQNPSAASSPSQHTHTHTPLQGAASNLNRGKVSSPHGHREASQPGKKSQKGKEGLQRITKDF